MQRRQVLLAAATSIPELVRCDCEKLTGLSLAPDGRLWTNAQFYQSDEGCRGSIERNQIMAVTWLLSHLARPPLKPLSLLHESSFLCLKSQSLLERLSVLLIHTKSTCNVFSSSIHPNAAEFTLRPFDRRRLTQLVIAKTICIFTASTLRPRSPAVEPSLHPPPPNLDTLDSSLDRTSSGLTSTLLYL